MGILTDFNELFNITWHTDTNGNKISVQILNEQKKVVNNKVLLNEIPDSFNGVQIANMVEVGKNGTINAPNEYKVNYLTGEIYFSPNLDGQEITIQQYYGRGLIKSFAIRILLLNNNDWQSDNLEDLAKEIKQYIVSNVNNLQTQINTGNTNHSTHLSSTSAHGSSSINNQSNVSGSKVTDALNTLKDNYDGHLSNISAHKDDSINNTSTVAGGKVKDALNTLKNADATLNLRIDNIIAQSGTSSTEVVDSRVSDIYGNFATLDARLEGIEKRSKYFLRQVTTVPVGSNTITLANLPKNDHKLLIYDIKYSCIWVEGLHWNRSGNIITFTESSFDEELTFVIYNFG